MRIGPFTHGFLRNHCSPADLFVQDNPLVRSCHGTHEQRPIVYTLFFSWQQVIGIARGRFSEYNSPMSLHRSLRSGGSTAAKRNVLKRFERVTLLKKRGQWKAGMKSTGLPKTKPE